MRSILTLLIALLVSCFSSAQQAVLKDTSHVQVRQFDDSKTRAYKNDPVFQYERMREPPQSLWDRFWSWFWFRLGQFFSSKPGQITFYVIIIPLAIGAIVYAVIKIMGIGPGSLFGKKNRFDPLNYAVGEENIHTIDFNEAIQQAVNDKNYRLAVRLLYLQSLKLLADKGRIDWRMDKTNYAYGQELAGQPFQQSFLTLTREFEYNWYGNRAASPAEFESIRQTFSDFNRQL